MESMDINPERHMRFTLPTPDREHLPTIEDFSNADEAKIFVRACLEGSYNEMGIEAWWERPRSQLAGMTPSEAWHSTPDKVILLAFELLG